MITTTKKVGRCIEGQIAKGVWSLFCGSKEQLITSAAIIYIREK